MKVNEFFENEYLVAGNTYDNFVFENCPKDFLLYAKSRLMQSDGDAKPCVVCLSKEQEDLVSRTLDNCAEDFQKKILARDFITAMVVKQMLDKDRQQDDYAFVCRQIAAFVNNDFDIVKQLHADSFMPFDVKRLQREVGKIELSFILDSTQNVYLQQAINIFVSSREPYSVKIFTNNESLPTYYDPNGNTIECPHDFMRRDVNDFLEEQTADKAIDKEQ